MKGRMTFRMPDGEMFGANTYGDVIRAMADMKLVRARSEAGFRKAIARRARAIGLTVDASTNAKLVKSLIAAELIERVA